MMNDITSNLKITIIVGGRWHAFDLARELYRKGFLHKIITIYPKLKTREWGIPDYKVVSFPWLLIIERLIYKIKFNYLISKSQIFIHRIFAFLALFYLKESDVIHGWAGYSYPAIKWAKKRNIPYILERSSSHILTQSEILNNEFKKLGIKNIETDYKIQEQQLIEYDISNVIAVPSIFVFNSFIKRGFNKKKLFLNNLGVNLERFLPREKSDEVFRVVYAGSLSVRKGIIYLVKAFLKASIPNSELILIGNYDSNIYKFIGASSKKIKLIGHINQNKLVNYYQNSSVFVMPSIEEGMAMVQIQALACGLPLICTTNTGGEDLLRLSGSSIEISKNIKEFPAGFLVPIRDPKAIEECLLNLHKSPEKLVSKRESAKKLRDSNLSWERYADRCIDLYKKIRNTKKM